MNIPLELLHPLLATVLAYLIGSVSFAVVVSRVMGLSDPRSYGSHNPGATNVLRSGNKLAALLTLLLDGVKGWLPVYAVVQFGAAYGLGQGSVALVALAAFWVMCGRCSSASKAARAWPRRRACCLASSPFWAWPPSPLG
jgi:acyl-phosphate glycerol 3-phosphate acyltransferase